MHRRAAHRLPLQPKLPQTREHTMIKNVILLALASTAALPSLAQDSLTLFGVVDVAARRVSNQGQDAAYSVVSGSNATSRWGVRGQEDLGGGSLAGVHLESGFNAGTGVLSGGTQMFDRRATVSLSNAKLGELRAGRDFVPSYSSWSRYDPFGYVGAASSSSFVSATPAGPIRAAFSTNPNTTVRANSLLQWLLPAGLAGGLEGVLALAPGEGGDATAGKAKLVGLRLGYANGPLSLSAAATRSTNSLTGSAQFSDQSLGGSYNFGVARISMAWRQFELADASQTHQLLGAWIPIGQHELKASWHRVDRSGKVGSTAIASNSATLLGLGYGYALSKRTALYATYAQISNDGASNYAVSGGAGTLVVGGKSTGYEAGMRHSF